jgi:hypothetical protein
LAQCKELHTLLPKKLSVLFYSLISKTTITPSSCMVGGRAASNAQLARRGSLCIRVASVVAFIARLPGGGAFCIRIRACRAWLAVQYGVLFFKLLVRALFAKRMVRKMHTRGKNMRGKMHMKNAYEEQAAHTRGHL